MSSDTAGPAWGRRERGWLWTFFAAYAAAALPWLWRSLDVPLPAIAGWLLAAGLGQLLLAWLAARTLRGRALGIARALLHAGATLVLCWVWHLAGGLDNPAFLLVLTLPLAIAATTGAADRRRFGLWATAALIVVAVAVIAWARSPDLRWYSLRLGLPLEWAVAWASPLGDGAAPDSAATAPAHAFVILVTFALAVLSLAAALAAGAEQPAERAAGDWRKALEAMPIGWLLVRETDGTVLEAGRRWLRDHGLAPSAVRGADLDALIDWREGAPGDGRPGAATGEPVLYRVHGVTHAAAVATAAIAGGGEARTLLTFRAADPREALARIAGDDPWLLIDERRRAVDFNGAAARLLPDLRARADIATLCGRDDPGPPAAGWWHPGDGEVRLGGARLRCAAEALRSPSGPDAGEEQVFVHLRPVPEAR